MKGVALAWVLQRSPNLVLIPSTSSVEHLGQNLAAVKMQMPTDAASRFDTIAAGATTYRAPHLQ